jgi:hypothetical protein
MQFLPYGQGDSVASCDVKAKAPKVGQTKTTVLPGAGATGGDILAPVASGGVPYHAGSFSNPSCADVELTITYLDGADCDECTTDTITTVTQVVQVGAGLSGKLPEGLISGITYRTGTIDDAGVFTAGNVTSKVSLNWSSSYTPCCGQTLVP